MIYLRQVAPAGVSTVPWDTLFSVHCSLLVSPFFNHFPCMLILHMEFNREGVIKIKRGLLCRVMMNVSALLLVILLRLVCCHHDSFCAVMHCPGLVAVSFCGSVYFSLKWSRYACIAVLHSGRWFDERSLNVVKWTKRETFQAFSQSQMFRLEQRKPHAQQPVMQSVHNC